MKRKLHDAENVYVHASGVQEENLGCTGKGEENCYNPVKWIVFQRDRKYNEIITRPWHGDALCALHFKKHQGGN